MKRIFAILCLAMLSIQPAWAKSSPTPLQMFFTIKKIFPSTAEISVFLSREQLESDQNKIARAAKQSQLKAVLYPIENAADIGKNLKKLEENSFLVLFDSDIIKQKSSKLYILSKCKEKNIFLVTSSRDYADSGALLNILPEGKRTTVVLNLRHYQDLSPKFTSNYIQETGISQVIQ